MKILRPGRQPAEWSQEVTCTGTGNGNNGCRALLLAEKSDLFKTCVPVAGVRPQWHVTFRCPECGVSTDIGPYPTDELDDLLPLRAWEAHQTAKGSDAGAVNPPAPETRTPAGISDAVNDRLAAAAEWAFREVETTGSLTGSDNAYRELGDAVKAYYATEAPAPASPPQETRTPAGDRLRDAVERTLVKLCNMESVDLHGEEYDALVNAAYDYDYLPAAPDPDRVVVDRAATSMTHDDLLAEARKLSRPPAAVVDRAALEELRTAASFVLHMVYREKWGEERRRLDRAIDATLTTPAPEA